jgi:uncharacterized membrane protein required for colicin V production
MLKILIDLILLVIIAYCGWMGYKKGLIPGLLSIFVIIISLYGANIVAQTYSGEFTPVLEPFVSGIVDKTSEESSQMGQGNLSIEELARQSLINMGILSSAADNIAKSVAESTTEGGYVLRKALVNKLCGILAYVITATVVFVLIIIFFTVIYNIINLDFKLPGLESINNILGTVFGVIKGLLIVFAIAWLLRFGGLLIKEEIVEKTLLLKFFMANNILNGIFGF